MDQSNVVWRLVSAADLYLRSWQNESVVFDQRSGDTHIINHLAAEVLVKLKDGQKDVLSLSTELAHTCHA